MSLIYKSFNSIRSIFPPVFWKLGSKLYWKIVAYKNLIIGRRYTPGETTKAKERRLRENFFEKYTQGHGLDIGFGGDPLLKDISGWDFENGDAQYLESVLDDSYDFVYSSHTIEHMVDARISIQNWYRVLKSGGHLILYIPHRDLYEKKRTRPSTFNENHYHFFLPFENDPPDTIGVKQLIEENLKNFEIIYIKECSENHTITDPLLHSDGEYSIEVVVKKL